MAKYEIGREFEFTIQSFRNAINSKNEPITYISLILDNNHKSEVLGSDWQTSELWKYGTLRCIVKGYDDEDNIILINSDNRHPIFKINQIYRFEVINRYSKTMNFGEIINVFRLRGLDNCFHEGIVKDNENSQFLDYKIKNIKPFKVYLTPVHNNDSIFETFESIVNDIELEKAYFKPIISDTLSSNKNIQKLIDQYNSKASFWVFTYANVILPNLMREEINKYNYKNALKINELIERFEEYILKSGIIKQFKEKSKRENTVLKTKAELKQSKLIKEILLNFCSNSYIPFKSEVLFSSNKEILINQISYILSFSNFELIEYESFFQYLKQFLISPENEIEFHYTLQKICSTISYKKKKRFLNKVNYHRRDFQLTLSKESIKNNFKDEIEYIKWTYCEILILKKLSLHLEANILIGQLLRHFIKYQKTNNEKEKIILCSYFYFQNYENQSLPIPFNLENELGIDERTITELIANSKNDDINEILDEIEISTIENKKIIVKLTGKNARGFEVSYKEVKGFLPNLYVIDPTLKSLPVKNYDIDIIAEFTSFNKSFQFYTIKHIIEPDNPVRVKQEDLSVNQIFDMRVTKVLSNRINIKSINSEIWGHLPIQKIFDPLDIKLDYNSDLSDYFKVGELIKLSFLETNSNGINIFSFASIKLTMPEYYYSIVDKTLNKPTIFENKEDEVNQEDNFIDIIQNEIAFCLEQFIFIQSDLVVKIQCLEIAKILFANIASARSYLLNIFIDYLQVLIEIKSIIEQKSFKKLDAIREKGINIIDNIDKKTISIFPESKRLIYFLEIISQFNNVSNESLKLLFENCITYSEDALDKDLATIAKLTLANNLIISESTDNQELSFKNLRSIHNYLSNGILSLNETQEDKEYNDLIQLIENDENERVEFKSTLFVPLEFKNNKIGPENDSNLKLKVTHSSMKTLVAFANTHGGTLIIGVNDDKKILGLKNDYSLFNKKHKYRDEFGKKFDSTVKDFIGDDFFPIINKSFINTPEGDVLRVDVNKSSKIFFLLKDERGERKEELYIRAMASTRYLRGYELSSFIISKLGTNFNDSIT